MEMSFSMIVIIALGVMVLVVSSYLVYVTAMPSVEGIDKMAAISKCDDVCSNDPIKGVVSLNGVCAYNPGYKTITTEFELKDEGKLKCFEITPCYMPSQRGRCLVTNTTRYAEETCRVACDLDGGNYFPPSESTSGDPIGMLNMCDLVRINRMSCSGVCVRGVNYFRSDKC